MLFTQAVRLALAFAAASAGNSMAAKMAMMAMTTSNSINVKAFGLGRFISINSGSEGVSKLSFPERLSARHRQFWRANAGYEFLSCRGKNKNPGVESFDAGIAGAEVYG
jgi:hypothetical protein